ncbi:BA14K family protein [Roseibium polysiphoniae]|uniref:BA14K family protein n=1 Tax=Roseibium polysiphoniae TaxID=2571221 RepID=UPI002599AFCF|nr:BA14K family protein [uncultured Roseibium sp.]
MFRNNILKAAAVATIAVTSIAIGVGAASAGNYGYKNSYNNGYGYHKSSGYSKKSSRPFAHIKDHVWKQHVSWCHNRFKSYNSYDNSYQPYNGPRQHCWSPYISG